MLTDQHESQQQGTGTGTDMSVKRPLVCPEETGVSTMQEGGFKIRRQIVAVVHDDSNGDLDDQNTRQQLQDKQQPSGIDVLHSALPVVHCIW